MLLSQKGISSRLLLGVWLSCALSACSFDLSGNTRAAASPPPLPPQVAAAAAASDMDTIRGLLPPEGLRTTPLFHEPLASYNDRIDRLETVVQDMRDDLDTVVPAVAMLSATERDNRIIDQQQQTLAATITPPEPLPASQQPLSLTATPSAPETTAAISAPATVTPPAAAPPAPLPDNTPRLLMQLPAQTPAAASPPVVTAPAPATPVVTAAPTASPASQLPAQPEIQVPPVTITEPKPAPAPAPAPAPTSAPAAPTLGDVKGLRFADHSDKTRLVLDMTTQYAGTARLENNGKTLVMPLTQLNWLGAQSIDVESAELVSAYHVADGNLYIDLMYPAQIREQKTLSPAAAGQNYRTLVDLFSADIHKK